MYKVRTTSMVYHEHIFAEDVITEPSCPVNERVTKNNTINSINEETL